MNDTAHTVVVTGGNKGIGADISHRFLAAGDTVVNISRDTPEFEHPKLVHYAGDLADREQTEQLATQIAAEHKVTHFVHNAGVIRPALIDEVQLADLDYLTQLHLGSAITLTQKFIPHMRSVRFGRIILISSRGVLGLVTRTNYSATKAGQIGMVRTWALELASDNITVNCVAPGPIKTEMFRELVPEDSEQEKKIAASVPMQRVGTAADIGRVVHFLCEKESDFITGQTLYVCGGASLGSLVL
ncbi:MAG: SDR family NAD(P)-dependent oxidoreductase [Gammaproteobacteria bacterium]